MLAFSRLPSAYVRASNCGSPDFGKAGALGVNASLSPPTEGSDMAPGGIGTSHSSPSYVQLEPSFQSLSNPFITGLHHSLLSPEYAVHYSLTRSWPFPVDELVSNIVISVALGSELLGSKTVDRIPRSISPAGHPWHNGAISSPKATSRFIGGGSCEASFTFGFWTWLMAGWTSL